MARLISAVAVVAAVTSSCVFLMMTVKAEMYTIRFPASQPSCTQSANEHTTRCIKWNPKYSERQAGRWGATEYYWMRSMTDDSIVIRKWYTIFECLLVCVVRVCVVSFFAWSIWYSVWHIYVTWVWVFTLTKWHIGTTHASQSILYSFEIRYQTMTTDARRETIRDETRKWILFLDWKSMRNMHAIPATGNVWHSSRAVRNESKTSARKRERERSLRIRIVDLGYLTPPAHDLFSISIVLVMIKFTWIVPLCVLSPSPCSFIHCTGLSLRLRTFRWFQNWDSRFPLSSIVFPLKKGGLDTMTK